MKLRRPKQFMRLLSLNTWTPSQRQLCRWCWQGQAHLDVGGWCCNMGGGNNGAVMDTDCPGLVDSWLFGQRAISLGQKKKWTRVWVGLIWCQCTPPQTCTLWTKSKSSPFYVLALLKKREKKKSAFSLSLFSRSVTLSGLLWFFL